MQDNEADFDNRFSLIVLTINEKRVIKRCALGGMNLCFYFSGLVLVKNEKTLEFFKTLKLNRDHLFLNSHTEFLKPRIEYVLWKTGLHENSRYVLAEKF